MTSYSEITPDEDQATCLLDDRIDPGSVLYTVFVLGEKLTKLTLTRECPGVEYEGHSIGVVGDRLLVSGEAVKAGVSRVSGLELLVVPAGQGRTRFMLIDEADDFLLGPTNSAHVRTAGNCMVVVRGGEVIIQAGDEPVYFDGQKVAGQLVAGSIGVGDWLLTTDYALEKRPSQWKLTTFTSDVDLTAQSLLEQAQEREFPQSFPNYQRSPRIQLEAPDDKIEILRIEAAPKPNKNGLLKAILPPLGMLAMTALTTVLSGRNPLMMMSMGFMSLITASFTVSQYVTEKKERRAQDRQRNEDYESYLLDTVSRVSALYDTEKRVLHFKAPSPDQLAVLVASYDSRIYERMRNNKDFLSISLGTGDAASSLSLSSDASERDTGEDAARVRVLVARFSTQHDVPITVNIMAQTLGLVGVYDTLKTAVANLLFQVAFFHSYRDVNFICLVPEKSYRNDWAGWRFLPHFSIQELNLRGLVHNAQTRDMVLGSFYQILNKRKQELKEAGRDRPVFAPHYVFTVFDDSYLAGHGINEFLAEDLAELGVTVVWCKEDQKLLPETVTALVTYKNHSAATLVNDDRVYMDTDLRPYPAVENMEAALRKLANLRHVEVEKNAIPESVSFLELYKVKEVHELGVEGRWAGADTSKTLAVPLGLRGKDDLVELNLHERAHGPHGLVAGTTGSGKSEIVQSYILSLAVNFAPEDVGFLPIDFKGGGMANLFTDLPHLLGSITNLDGAASARALASIRAELQKRQRLFGEFGVNHINGYTRLYKLGKAETAPEEKAKYPTQPLPHLFLISDEFAELKANQPEFMDELVSTARIGRSLGVHLILATQKPSGVVNDQIWSNSRFKLALKVADTSDSQEIIKTPDAASIVEPGRAYLQVGNNEIYELFQSAWSGADYDPTGAQTSSVDERIYRINDFGQYELWTQDLSGDEAIAEVKKEKVTELDAVVAHIAAVADRVGAVIPDKPWLPPLAARIASPEAGDSIGVPLGLLDIPSRQTQEPYIYDIQQASHTAIFSSPGYGKSTVLQTMVMNLARANTPERIQFNLLDFGNNGLLPLKDLPHVADIVTLEEEDKLTKMMGRISQTLAERKGLLKRAGVATLDQYHAKGSDRLPLQVTVLDGYDALAQDKRKDTIDTLLMQVLREGAALGVFLVLTANRGNSIRLNMSGNIQTKMALYMNDEAEVVALFGRDRVAQAEIAGRGQLVLDAATAIQFYLPAEGVNDSEVLARLEVETAAMARSWSGPVPAKIPMVPDELSLEAFNHIPEAADWLAVGLLPLGMSFQTTNIVGLAPGQAPWFLLCPSDDDQQLVFQQLLLHQIAETKTRAVLVDFGGQFEETPGELHDAVSAELLSAPDDVPAITGLIDEYTRLAKAHDTGEPLLLVIADLGSFIAATKIGPEEFSNALKHAHKAGLTIVIFAPHAFLAKSFDPVPKALRELKYSGLVGSRPFDTPLIKTTGQSSEPPIALDEAYFVAKGGSVWDKTKLPSTEDVDVA